MSVLDTLAQDHRVLETTLADLAATPHTEREHRTRLFQHLQGLLAAHARTEEEVVYRPLRAKLPDEPKILEAYEEHHIADVLLLELSAECPGGPGWTARVRVFEEVLRHHIKEEESVLFTLAQDAFAPNVLTRMDQEFRAVKHEGLERALGPLRRATPAFAGRATVTAQASAGRYTRRGELFLRRKLARG
ncbi:MAG TPA: hemerythrin domain-containing protein [Nevskiaceae bacterium]|nr:hemerythrin domain-containing protein [Nevskiaceae bacterium]